jgi:hypothetical protein
LERHIKVCGIPHLAKNQRDVGHPLFVAGADEFFRNLPSRPSGT